MHQMGRLTVKRLAVIFAVLLTLPLVAAPSKAAATSVRLDGRACTVADRGSETWFGFFQGKQKVFAPLKGDDVGRTFSAWRCFASEDECSVWKAGMQTDFPVGPMLTFCRQGG
jgi:hypothetical protein